MNHHQMAFVTHLTPLKWQTARMSSGSSSGSGHWKLSMMGMMLHCDCRAATISRCTQSLHSTSPMQRSSALGVSTSRKCLAWRMLCSRLLSNLPASSRSTSMNTVKPRSWRCTFRRLQHRRNRQTFTFYLLVKFIKKSALKIYRREDRQPFKHINATKSLHKHFAGWEIFLLFFLQFNSL